MNLKKLLLAYLDLSAEDRREVREGIEMFEAALKGFGRMPTRHPKRIAHKSLAIAEFKKAHNL